jgi:hypothetical protein
MFLRLVALRRSRPWALEDEASSFAHIRDDIVVVAVAVVDVVGIAVAVVDVVGIPEVANHTDAVGVGPTLDS